MVDSTSMDGTAELARSHSARVISVPRDQFDHGGTRDAALRQTTGEFVLFLTQDALPADERYIEHLLKPFADERVAAASGRQLPRPDARPYVRAVQHYRYPAQSRVWGAEDREALGIRAYHLSDVCSATAGAPMRRWAASPIRCRPMRTCSLPRRFWILVTGWPTAPMRRGALAQPDAPAGIPAQRAHRALSAGIRRATWATRVRQARACAWCGRCFRSCCEAGIR